MSTIDCYVKIDGIEGESKHKGAEGQIEVQGFEWQVTNASNPTTGGGSGIGKAMPGVFVFSHLYDKAAPTIQKSCATGKHIASVKFTMNKSGDGQKEFLTVTLKQVTVSKVDMRCDQRGYPENTVELSFADIEFEYKPQDDKGAMGGAVKFGWDVRSTEVR